MAQRMESVAPPGGVMLSQSTARLVENAVVLGQPQLLRIKGFPDPVSACELVSLALRLAERRGDDFALTAARLLRGFLLLASNDPQRSDGLQLTEISRKAILEKQFITAMLHVVDLQTAHEKARNDDRDGAVELLRTLVDREFTAGNVIHLPAVGTALVEALLQRGTDADISEAHTVIERLAAVPTEPGFVLYEVTLLRLRALLARARGDDMSCRRFVDHYHAMATSLGFEGHIAMADSMLKCF
jgi:adenylate cyclase